MFHCPYEIWFSRGTGLARGPAFRSLEDARRYVRGHRGEASFAIKGPDGHWETQPRTPPGWARSASFR